MCKEALEKYLKSFKLFLPFILVKLAFEISTFKVTNGNALLDKYGFIKKGNSLPNMASSIGNSIGILLVSLFLAPLFYSFLQLITKNIIKEEEVDYEKVNYKDSFRESLRFYLRYLGLTIIIIFIFGGIMLCSLLVMIHPIFIVGVVILAIYIGVTITPCTSYLIHYDTSAEEALSKGRALGKKYFWSIFFVGLISGIINSIVNAIAKGSSNTNIITFAVVSFISITIELYMYVFTMYICREEEPLSKDRLQSAEDN
ncbi:hypothetical protein [Clostridium lundense]|uniref:hypothetical protein n=1 Tax=Clostridium lundense TaxID=319475 RepID=UPI00048961EC|nr:hypothetical protein [Clostridium lundense]